MQQARSIKEPGFSAGITLSTLLHGALFASLFYWQQFVPDPGPVQTTYYVDVVNLPVASPRSGSPVQTADSGEVAAPPPQTAAPVMAAPSAKGPAPSTQTSQNDSMAFLERLAKLEGKVDSQRQAQRIEELRARVAEKGKAGVPLGTGSEAGSDYTAYIHSRLKDAFRQTISYQTNSPFVAIRLTIDAEGKLIRAKLEKSSNDKVFELSVRRAVNLAEKSLTPPPGRVMYEGVFLFRPQGVVQQ